MKNPFGAGIYIKDIAEVKDTYEDADSYARLDGRNVITLNVIKGSGKNLINASEKIHEIIDEMQATEFPDGLNVITTAEQADNTEVTETFMLVQGANINFDQDGNYHSVMDASSIMLLIDSLIQERGLEPAKYIKAPQAAYSSK